MCRRMKVAENEHIDSVSVGRRCFAEREGDIQPPCKTCRRQCKSLACKERHDKICGTIYTVCPSCRKTYANSKNYVHICGDAFCHVCYRHYSVEKPHFCKIPKTKLQATYDKMAAWDLEVCLQS